MHNSYKTSITQLFPNKKNRLKEKNRYGGLNNLLSRFLQAHYNPITHNVNSAFYPDGLQRVNTVENNNKGMATSNAVYEGLIKKQDMRFGTSFVAGSYNSGYCLLLAVANNDNTGNHEVGFQCVVDIFAGNTFSSVLVNVFVRGAGTAVNVKTFTTLIMGGYYNEDYAERIKATYQVVNNHYVVRLFGIYNAYWQRYNIKLLKVWNQDCLLQSDIFESKVVMPCSHESALTGTEITRYSMNRLS